MNYAKPKVLSSTMPSKLHRKEFIHELCQTKSSFMNFTALSSKPHENFITKAFYVIKKKVMVFPTKWQCACHA